MGRDSEDKAGRILSIYTRLKQKMILESMYKSTIIRQFSELTVSNLIRKWAKNSKLHMRIGQIAYCQNIIRNGRFIYNRSGCLRKGYSHVALESGKEYRGSKTTEYAERNEEESTGYVTIV